jgi:DNA-binding NarL/FixJ family response regulator
MKSFVNQEFNLLEVGGSIGHKLRRIELQEFFRQEHKLAFDSLTSREVQILKLLVHGLNNPQIANQLFISRFTVEQHRKNINKKLDIHSYSQLFQYALAFDLI